MSASVRPDVVVVGGAGHVGLPLAVAFASRGLNTAIYDINRAAALFRHLTDSIVELEPEEAELAKLFTNTWRYIKFAAANQFYVMANDHGLDYDVIRKALAHDYPRAKDMPGAGFAAGPCLFKDTMQLAAF